MLPVDVLVGRLRGDSLAEPLKLNGVTINLSRSGMLARVDQPVPPGTFCVVRFLVGEQEIAPEILRGIVRRAEPTDTGCELAVEFETALEALKVLGLDG